MSTALATSTPTAGRIATAAGRYLSAPLLLALAALLVAIGGEAWQRALQYDRTAIASGQLWRLVTCHWTHWNSEHLLWDAAVFSGLGLVAARDGTRRFWAAVVGSALSISVAVLWLQPWMQTYRGLSGIDAALFGVVAVGMLRECVRERRWPGLMVVAAALIGFVLKTAFELLTGGAVFVDAGQAGFVAVPLAHLIGAGVGAAVAIIEHYQVK